MKIQNETKSKTIELNTIEAEVDHYPSYRLKIAIITEEIKASFEKSIWITEVDLNDFITKLNELEKSRNNEVKLNSMSPGEFQLGFRNLDLLGHLAVELQIEKNDIQGSGYAHLVKIGFEIEGRRKNHRFSNGGYVDEILLGMINPQVVSTGVGE